MIEGMIREALKNLITEDGELIQRGVREESINHRFAFHLSSVTQDLFARGYHLDVEYDRNKNFRKAVRIDDRYENIRPDIIIHRRNHNTHNFLVIEAKKLATSTGCRDEKKIFGLFEAPYNYQNGCLVSYLPKESYIEYRIFQNQVSGQIRGYVEKK